jgi:drug/metabolite transporter (DMT)-like permease
MNTTERMSSPAYQAADRLDVRAVLILIGCCACWGVNQVAIKIASEGISPILQAGLRSLLSGVLVFAWASARGIRLFERDRTLCPASRAACCSGSSSSSSTSGSALPRRRAA